jgi:hypothetical protein
LAAAAAAIEWAREQGGGKLSNVGRCALQPLVAYILILLTVAAIAVLPQLIGGPNRRNRRNIRTDIPSHPSDEPAQVAPVQAVLAEVD